MGFGDILYILEVLGGILVFFFLVSGVFWSFFGFGVILVIFRF